MDQDEELNYVSSSPFTTPVETIPKDEEDLPTIKKLQRQMQDRIDSYKDIMAIDYTEQFFTVREQIAMNQEMANRTMQDKMLLDNTIDNIKEKYSDD